MHQRTALCPAGGPLSPQWGFIVRALVPTARAVGWVLSPHPGLKKDSAESVTDPAFRGAKFSLTAGRLQRL
jgi:hypothetical protein